MRSIIKINGNEFFKEGSKSGGARVLLCCAQSILYAHVLCKCGLVFLIFVDHSGYFWQAVGSRGRPWEGRGDALGRVSEKRRNNASFKAVPAAHWEPCGAFWRPFIPFSVPLGAVWMMFFTVFPNHVLDGF